MRPALLALDSALDAQPAFLTSVGQLGAGTTEARDIGPRLRLWSRPPPLDALRTRLRSSPRRGAELLFCGSGDFHHVTALLVERVAEATGNELTLLHFDNHPDWVRFKNGLHCGSWAAHTARQTHVRRVVTVGVCSRDIRDPLPSEADLSVVHDGLMEVYPYGLDDGRRSLRIGEAEWPTVESLGEESFTGLLLSRVQTRDVYVTIDKDVFTEAEAVTNWDQGRTSIAFVETAVRAVAANHRIVGADIVGDWSPQVFAGNPLEALLKRAEAFLDQPRRGPAPDVASVNERTNLRLLSLFEGIE